MLGGSGLLVGRSRGGLFGLAVPFVVDSVMTGGLNADAGLRRGDRVVAIDGHGIEYVQDFRELAPGLSGQELDATIVRDADTLGLPVRVDSLGHIGVYLNSPNIQVQHFSLLEAIPAGWKETVIAFSLCSTCPMTGAVEWDRSKVASCSFTQETEPRARRPAKSMDNTFFMVVSINSRDSA